MKNIFIILYLICIMAMSAVSMTVSNINDSSFMFYVECLTNLIAIIGILLFLSKFRSKWWIIPFAFLVIGEIYLLIFDVNLTTTDIFFICIVFAPAIYWNYLVTQANK